VDRRDRAAIKADSLTLLIIEDDKNFAKTLMKEGRRNDFLCLVSESGHAGFALALKYQPSAIFLDIGLPDMSGKQVLSELKQHLKTRHIPVHIISAAEEDIDLKKMGSIGFLQKPIKKTDLELVFKKIEALLGKNIKQLLVVEDAVAGQKAIKKLMKNKQIKILFASNGKEARKSILNEVIDCIILDLNLPDISGFELLKSLTDERVHLPPVIVYTGKTLTEEEYCELRKFTSSIVIKGVNSPERLLDEASMFLHSVGEELSKEQQGIIQTLYAPEKILEGRKILLVDDDMRNLFALSKVLKKAGLLIEVAKDGAFALKMLAETKGLELVIMDIMMPVMDGYTAIEKIRAQKQFKQLPIIALTAKAMPEDYQKCINVGASDYLAKPVDVERLLSLIRVWLGKA